MKRIVLTIVLLLLSVSVKNVHAETGNIVMEKGISKEEVVNIVNEEIGYKLLEAEKNLEEKIHDGYQQAVDSTTSIANNSFSAQWVLLSTFSILIWFILVLIGWLVSWYVTKMLKIIDSKSRDISETKAYIESLQIEIEKYPELLYHKLEETEVAYTIDRLTAEPEEIVNSYTYLTTKKIWFRFYEELCKLFSISKEWDYSRRYLFLLLENFPEKLFLDKNLWKDVIGKIDFQTNTFDSERKNIISRITKTFLIQPDKLKLQYIEFIKWCKADIYQSHKSMIKEIFKDNAQTDLYEEIMNLVETSRPTLAELLSNKA